MLSKIFLKKSNSCLKKICGSYKCVIRVLCRVANKQTRRFIFFNWRNICFLCNFLVFFFIFQEFIKFSSNFFFKNQTHAKRNSVGHASAWFVFSAVLRTKKPEIYIFSLTEHMFSLQLFRFFSSFFRNLSNFHPNFLDKIKLMPKKNRYVI